MGTTAEAVEMREIITTITEAIVEIPTVITITG